MEYSDYHWRYVSKSSSRLAPSTLSTSGSTSLLYSADNEEMSLQAYEEAVEELKHIIDHTESHQEKARLKSIMDSYFNRITFLSQMSNQTPNTNKIPMAQEYPRKLSVAGSLAESTLPFLHLKGKESHPSSLHLYVNKDLPALPTPPQINSSSSSTSTLFSSLAKKPNMSTRSIQSRKTSIFNMKPSISTPIKSFSKSFSMKKSSQQQSNRFSTDLTNHSEKFTDTSSEISSFDNQNKFNIVSEVIVEIQSPSTASIGAVDTVNSNDTTLTTPYNPVEQPINKESNIGTNNIHEIKSSASISSQLLQYYDNKSSNGSLNSVVDPTHHKENALYEDQLKTVYKQNNSLISISESDNDSKDRKSIKSTHGKPADRLSNFNNFFKFNGISNRTSVAILNSNNQTKTPDTKQTTNTTTNPLSSKSRKAPLSNSLKRTKSKWQLSSVTPTAKADHNPPHILNPKENNDTSSIKSGKNYRLSYFAESIPEPADNLDLSEYIHHDTQSALGLIKKLLNSISSGGYVTTHLYIPADLWQQVGVPLPALDAKITSCDLLITILQKMNSRVNFDNYNGMSSELRVLEQALVDIKETLIKKIDGYTDALKNASAESTIHPKPSRNSLLVKNGSTGKTSQALATWNSKLSKSVERIKYEISRATLNGEQNELYIKTLIQFFSSITVLETWLLKLKQHITRQTDDKLQPGYRMLLIRNEKCIQHIGVIICSFVVRDQEILLDRWLKRSISHIID